MTQCDRVIDYIKQHGSITQLEAMTELGVFRLASRINDLKRAGYGIGKKTVTGVNRFGEAVRYAEYYLLPEVE